MSLIDFGQNTPRIRKQCLAGVRELSAAPRADKELNTEMTLQRPARRGGYRGYRFGLSPIGPDADRTSVDRRVADPELPVVTICFRVAQSGIFLNYRLAGFFELFPGKR